MKYTIITLNDDRALYKENIRKRVKFDEVELPAVNGSFVDLDFEMSSRGLHSPWGNAKKGEIGVWLSNFDRWQWAAENDETLIVFEDDAIPAPHFTHSAQAILDELPDDWDFLSLWVPDNQKVDYQYDLVYNHIGDPIIYGRKPYHESLFAHSILTAHVYQGYGMVALAYSPVGGRKLVSLARQTGACTPVDCWIYQQAHLEKLNGFAPTPPFANLVGYDWLAPSHVQQTDKAQPKEN